ncbi:MAG: hypothetical protein QXK06_01220 [Candidatus Diapherotrites archaeon]
MKRLDVKKLAAIGAGAALIGMALAPMAAAALTKNEVLKGDNTPFDVVVGKNAATSDYLWAGNIAAKLAQLASADTAVSCTAIGWQEGKGPTGTGSSTDCPLTDLSVDLAVGGTSILKPGTGYSYTSAYLTSSDSLPSPVEWNNGMLGKAQVDSLLDTTWSYKYNNGNYTQTVKEFIGVKVNAKMDTRNDVKDLVAYMTAPGDFNYMVRLGAGIPYNPSFIKNDQNLIYVPWFGKKLVLLSANSSEVKLIDESKKQSYYAGEKIPNIKGKGDYAGKDLTLEFSSLIYRATQGTYEARFRLYNDAGTLIDEKTITQPGTFLESVFTQMETSVYVDDFAKEDITDKGFVTVTVGSNTVMLVDGGIYPYDSTVTSNSKKYWITKFTKTTATVGATSNVPVISEITVYNNGIENYSAWNNKNPLWATADSLNEHSAAKAVFLNGAPEGSLGYGYAAVEFKGWKTGEETTCMEIGADISATKDTKASDKGITYLDTGDNWHAIPFYISSLYSTTEQDFIFDKAMNKKYYFRMGTSATDLNVCNGDYLNGIPVRVVSGSGIAIDGGNYGNTVGATVDVNGVAYVIRAQATGDNCIRLDTNGWFQISKQSFDNPLEMVKGYAGNTVWNDRFYFDSKNTITAYPSAKVELIGDNEVPFYYAYAYDGSGRIWLMLDASTNFAPKWGNADIALVGTEINNQTETGTPNTTFYVPDDFALDSGNRSGYYRIATFNITDGDGSGTGSVYINTMTGGLAPVGNTNLTGYTYEASFTGNSTTLNLTYDNPSYNIQKAWTDYGSKIEIEKEGSWKMCYPQNRRYVHMQVLGPNAEFTVSGDKIEGIKEGETKTTPNNLSVTITKIYGTCGKCECAPGGGVLPGDVKLKVEPSTIRDVKKIGTQIVYTDDVGPKSNVVIVGGHLVNRLAKEATFEDGLSLADKLTSAGQKVTLKTADGDWVVAGFTASDTASAARDFIEWLDQAFGK